jgi:hypothetical protein
MRRWRRSFTMAFMGGDGDSVVADGVRELLQNQGWEGNVRRDLNRKEKGLRLALTREGSWRCYID